MYCVVGWAASPRRVARPWTQVSIGSRSAVAQRFQVLGSSLDSPAEFVLCWTADGEASGGTGQALRIAASHGVPVFNLQRERERAHVERHLVL